MLTTFLTPSLLQVSSPLQQAVQGEELLDAKCWPCCFLTPRNQGRGETQGKDRSCGAGQASCTRGGSQLSGGPRGRGCGCRAAALCAAPQKPSREGILACARLGTRWLCAGGRGSKVLGMCANRHPLVTLSHVLIIFPHKKAPVLIKELTVFLRTRRVAFLLCYEGRISVEDQHAASCPVCVRLRLQRRVRWPCPSALHAEEVNAGLKGERRVQPSQNRSL